MTGVSSVPFDWAGLTDLAEDDRTLWLIYGRELWLYHKATHHIERVYGAGEHLRLRGLQPFADGCLLLEELAPDRWRLVWCPANPPFKARIGSETWDG